MTQTNTAKELNLKDYEAYQVPNVRFKIIREGTTTTVQNAKSTKNPIDAYMAVADLIGNADTERLAVILLDTHNKIIATHVVYVGSLDTCVIRIAEIFKAAIIFGAPSIIVAHNHPTGDATPSDSDITTTKMIMDGGQTLDIAVLDHIILGNNSFISLRERGLMGQIENSPN